jgi:hypothetical protein
MLAKEGIFFNATGALNAISKAKLLAEGMEAVAARESLTIESSAAGGAGGRARFFAKPTVTGTTAMKAGEGVTDKYGNVLYSLRGTAKDVALARAHEAVHSALSPKFALLREFRANLMESAYNKSALLRYIEEAIAETTAQMRVNGIAASFSGLQSPSVEPYTASIWPLTSKACNGGSDVTGANAWVNQ